MTKLKPLATLIGVFLVASLAFAQEPTQASRTQIAMLGTGTPNPFPHRSGPSIAIVVNDQAYLVDLALALCARQPHSRLSLAAIFPDLQ